MAKVEGLLQLRWRRVVAAVVEEKNVGCIKVRLLLEEVWVFKKKFNI